MQPLLSPKMFVSLCEWGFRRWLLHYIKTQSNNTNTFTDNAAKATEARTCDSPFCIRTPNDVRTITYNSGRIVLVIPCAP